MIKSTLGKWIYVIAVLVVATGAIWALSRWDQAGIGTLIVVVIAAILIYLGVRQAKP